MQTVHVVYFLITIFLLLRYRETGSGAHASAVGDLSGHAFLVTWSVSLSYISGQSKKVFVSAGCLLLNYLAIAFYTTIGQV